MRIGTFSTYRRVLSGLRLNQSANIRAQEQLSSGRRILRPSDDPTGASRAIRMERQISDISRYRDAISQGINTTDSGASALTSASTLMIQARELLLQGMNGTYSATDRAAIATEIDLIREQLVDIANRRAGDTYLFGGTATTAPPWEEVQYNGRSHVLYRGNGDEQTIRAGETLDVAVTLSGAAAFGKFAPTGTVFGQLTGAMGGTTADQGAGYSTLNVRHDATLPGSIGTVGLGLVSSGAFDTLLGDNTLTIDAVAGTIQLGTGEVIPLPTTPDPNFVIKNEAGGELHLDFTTFAGASYTGDVRGEGSISLDGVNFTAFDGTETDLELSDSTLDRVVHVDTTAINRAGDDLVEFKGATNVFDLLGAIADDLRNDEGLEPQALSSRLQNRLTDIDRHHETILVGASTLGSRGARLGSADDRAADVGLQLEGLLSNVADADLSKVALDLSRSEYLLQLAQASGARLMQMSLLNFIG